MLLDPRALDEEIKRLAAGEYFANPADVIGQHLSLLTPPEDISTAECAERFRWVRAADGAAKQLWSRKLTPYLVGPMDAWDDPLCQEVIIVKPGRTGGTMAFENALFKEMRFGPMGDWLWYLGSKSEVDSYAQRGVKQLFDDHPEIAAKVGPGKSDDNIASKKVAGRSLEWLPANQRTITNRQAKNIIGDEIDTFPPRLCASFLDQARIRGRALGSRRRVGMTSHPDRGWGTGIASAWVLSDRGIYLWPCAECELWSSPWPTRFHDAVPRARLEYSRPAQGAPGDERIAMAKETAHLLCPHCGSLLTDAQRMTMTDAGVWLQGGQRFDASAGILGEPDGSSSRGFWVHGLMSKMVSNAELARDIEGAVEAYDRTKRPEKLREVTAKVFGEVYEGVGDAAGLDGGELIRRNRERERDAGGYMAGEVPPGVLFLTAAVDVGHAKFDVGIWGWDREGRSWLIDRLTLRQRKWSDGVWRDLRPSERIDDWMVLEDALVNRLLPMQGLEAAMPIACIAIDSGDGNVTWKAYEFARRMDRNRWGEFRRVKVIKGAGSVLAPELPPTPTRLSKDQNGRAVTPPVLLYTLGVHRLKEQALERLATTDGGPGQCHFPRNVARAQMDEFFAEKLIDGKFVRDGANETLDLFAYAEAARLMLQPDRAGIDWHSRRPAWATPVSLTAEGGDRADDAPETATTAPAAAKPSIFERMDRLNQTGRRPE